MARYSSTQQTPAQPTYEGDQEFNRLDMETEIWLLPPGAYHDGQNARCATGKLGKRAGTIQPLWAIVTGYPGAILGAGLYNNPNTDTKLMLIAKPTMVLKIAADSVPVQIGLPEDVTLAGPVEFAQHFDKVLLHQASGKPTYQWDGNPAHDFEVFSQVHPTAENTIVPPADWSVDYGGRNLFPISRDRFGVSDFEDYGSWDDTTRNYRANAGTADTLTALIPYQTGNLLIAKRASIDVFRNFKGDLSQLSAEVVSSTLGIWARKSFQMFGQEAMFLAGPRGVFRLSQVDQNRLATSPIPVSATQADGGRAVDPIAPLLRRINWPYADKAVSGIDGIYYALAVPIDSSTVNNCVLWFNTVSGNWEGYDVYDPRGWMQIDELIPFDYQGRQRLYAINKLTGTIHLLNEGKEDELRAPDIRTVDFGVSTTGRYEIDMDVTTRGYATLGWNATVKRDFKRVVIPVRTWRPSITLEEITEGALDNRMLTKTPITKDRTKYDRFGFKPYDVTNVNDDALVPGRQDYSVVLSGDDVIHVGSGIPIEQKQESVLGSPGGFSTKCRGRFVGYRIRCTQGECDVLGVLVESSGLQREARRAA